MKICTCMHIYESMCLLRCVCESWWRGPWQISSPKYLSQINSLSFSRLGNVQDSFFASCYSWKEGASFMDQLLCSANICNCIIFNLRSAHRSPASSRWPLHKSYCPIPSCWQSMSCISVLAQNKSSRRIGPVPCPKAASCSGVAPAGCSNTD